MLSIKQLGFRYHTETPYVFKALNYDLSSGSLVKLNGPNGSGKSTFIYALTGFLSQYLGGEMEGTVVFNDQNILEMSVKERIQTINAVFQDPDVQISFSGVYEELNCHLLYTQRRNDETDLKINNYLDLFGLQLTEKTKTSELSWGQKKMLCLISLFTNDPKVWLLDEPFSGLSFVHSEILAEVLEKKKKDGRIILLSDHTDYPMQFSQMIEFGSNVKN